jgi:fibronectin-binding autotransporter adhesin
MTRRLVTALILAAGLLMLPAGAIADLIWDYNGNTTPNQPSVTDGTGTWDTTLPNWYGGSSPNVVWSNASPTVAQLGSGGTGTYTITVDAGGVTATGLNVKANYTLQTGTVTLSGTAPLIAFPTGVASATTLIVNSNLVVTDGDSGTADNLILQGANGGTPGTTYWKVVLSGSNTYTGKLTIKNGVSCNPTTTTALGSVSTGTVVETNSSLKVLVPQGTLGAGQTLELSGYGFGKTALDTGRAALILAPQVDDTHPGATGDVIWAGNVLLNAESSIASVQNATYKNSIAGVISGGFNMIKTGEALLYLTNSNTYTGNTEIRRGGMTLDSALGPAINKLGGNLVFRADLSTNAAVVNVNQNEQIGDGAEVQFNYGGTTAGYQTINLLGHTETVKGLVKSTATSASAYIQNEAASLNSDLIVDTAGSSYSFNGVLRDGSAAGKGTLALEKKGLGTQTLAGVNTFSGPTVITGGTLALASTGSIANSPTINVGADSFFDVLAYTTFGLGGTQTLKGNGTVKGNVVSAAAGSHVQPGASIGTLTVSGSLTVGGTLDVEYNSTTDAIDLLAVSGALDLSAATIQFSDLGTGPGGPAHVAVLATYGTLTGPAAATAGIPAGYWVDYHYNSENKIALVPEPATLVLLLAGLALATLVRRTRR